MARTSTADAPKQTRTRRTPEQRATADLQKAEKQRDSATAKLAKMREGIAAAEADVQRAERFVDYASRNPDLPQAADSNQPEMSPASEQPREVTADA
jgi:hypothetical protein